MLGASLSAVNVTADKWELMLLLVGGHHSVVVAPHLPGEWSRAENFLQFFLVFCVGVKSLMLVSTGENYTVAGLVRDNAALPVFWFSKRDSLNLQKSLPQRSRARPSGCNTGRRGRRQREADGQHSMRFAWHLLLCYRKLRTELQWDQRERKKTLKPINIHKSRRNGCIDLNDHW